MADKIQAIRGMNDILPEQAQVWRELEALLADCLTRYGYQEIRFPLVESTQLFKRSIGEVTDVVEKEMYTFTDLNGDSLSLRPEGTAGCLRACIEHGLLHNQQQKLWYLGPMYRHEKPQKGRYRQFYQFGVEAIGIEGAAIELELIAMTHRLWQQLGVADGLSLQINTLGELQERQRYKETLQGFFRQNLAHLDEDSLRRLDKNPLRILDSKNPTVQALLVDAPKLQDSLGEESLLRFKKLCQGLGALGIAYDINPFLVRGLDYYGHTVFEWVTPHLGSQATVCAGGRYDALVAQLGGPQIPAVGFAMGMERLLLLIETLQGDWRQPGPPSVFLMTEDEQALTSLLALAEKLRHELPGWLVLTNTVGGSFKSQFKKADKSGALFAIVLGEEERRNEQVSVKSLRKRTDQVTIAQKQLSTYLQDNAGEE